MELVSGAVVIDLGTERGEPDSYGSPQRSTVPGWFPAAVLAVLVLFCATASAAPVESPLTRVFSLQVGPADAYALTTGGQLLAQTFGTLTSYDLSTGRMSWQAGQSTPAYRLRLSEGLVLMRPWSTRPEDPGTTAISVANGAAQWERSGNVINVAGSSALLAVEAVRSLGGAGRRVQGPIDAIDPLTGQTRWTVRVPSTAVLLGVPGPGDSGTRMLLVHDDRTLALHDLDTGRLLGTGKVPPADYNPNNPAVADGVILLRHPGERSVEISAYDPVTLKQMWTEPAGGTYDIKACGLLACLTGSDGTRALDPTTGDLRWSRPEWHNVEQRGAMFLAYGGADTSSPLGIVDPDTGRLRVDLTGWRPVGGDGSGDHLLVTRAVEAGARTMVAVARPGEGRPRLLADLPAGTGDCQAVPGRLVCRSMYGELVVWAYPREG
ncbi:MAG: PQQ-binding-like beta-propeller repeat protein [Actinoplanes sp.]